MAKRFLDRLVRPRRANYVESPQPAAGSTEPGADPPQPAVESLQSTVRSLQSRLDQLAVTLNTVRNEAGRATALAEDAVARADHALAVARDVSLPARIGALSTWLELRPPADGPLVSIVLATRDRSALLPRAVASVLAQRYPRWELIVVDDGTGDETRAALEPFTDGRIVVADGPRRGLGAARNAGLDRAGGDVACYLDDDNVMHPAWLQAVVHVFSNRADLNVLYGVSVAEHRIAGEPDGEGWSPAFWQLPWSRSTLLQENIADAGAIAHRRELGGARFDEQLRTGEDWDLLLRLTEDEPALAVPAVSHAYAIDVPGRMSRDATHRAGLEEIRRRHDPLGAG
jgi:Glycosyl transferase family 2